jgi:transketolase
VIHDDRFSFELGKAEVLVEGTDLTFVACGVMVSVALSACARLQENGISAGVINASSIKPLDAETIISSAARTGAVVTAEEHQIVGGLGSAVCEILAEQHPTRAVRVGIDDRFGQSGNADALLSHYGLDTDGLVAAANHVLAA